MAENSDFQSVAGLETLSEGLEGHLPDNPQTFSSSSPDLTFVLMVQKKWWVMAKQEARQQQH